MTHTWVWNQLFMLFVASYLAFILCAEPHGHFFGLFFITYLLLPQLFFIMNQEKKREYLGLLLNHLERVFTVYWNFWNLTHLELLCLSLAQNVGSFSHLFCPPQCAELFPRPNFSFLDFLWTQRLCLISKSTRHWASSSSLNAPSPVWSQLKLGSLTAFTSGAHWFSNTLNASRLESGSVILLAL